MRIKEAADRSGLTEKAIRLYEEKGLICPTITEINGRKFRDYDEATVAALKNIAGLRRSFFSLEQIAAMQENPERIPVIFTEYRNELKEQYDRLGMLIGKADEILSQIPETDPVEKPTGMSDDMPENIPTAPVITPAALRNVDTLSEAMTAVTPVVVSEEIPPSAPPKGKREKAELHFKRWDEEIAADEREIVYQRYLEYYSRWEKRYAVELAVGKAFGWIGRLRWILCGAAGAMVLGLLLYNLGIYTEYNRTFHGYLLMTDSYYDLRDGAADTVVYRSEPATLRMHGRILHYLWKQDRFEGTISIDGYTPAEEKISFYYPDEHPNRRDTAYSKYFTYMMYAPTGSIIMDMYIFSEEQYCFEIWKNETLPEDDTSRYGYMIFPADTEEEAVDWFDSVLRNIWIEQHEYWETFAYTKNTKPKG